MSLLEDIIGQYNSVFWIGDFNFRIDGDACPVENMLGDQNPNFEKILRSDQLLQLINEGKFHDGFHFILKFGILNLLHNKLTKFAACFDMLNKGMNVNKNKN